jgi:hypothetical protein
MVVTYGGCEAFAVEVKYDGVADVNIFYLVVIVIVLVVGGFAASAFSVGIAVFSSATDFCCR